MPPRPRRLGAFDLLDELGQGAMGLVYRGRHVEVGVEVAIKLVQARRGRVSAEAVRTLWTELRVLASLDHPNIARVLDFGEDDEGTPWFAMELARGGPIPRAAAPWPFTRRVLLGVLDALAHAHARGVLHRDLKPANLLVDTVSPGGVGRVLLADFGIAYPMGSGLPSAPSAAGAVSGTPGYMAPEQFADDRAAFGPWTDLYALGCVAWMLASGQPPFGRATMPELAAAHLRAVVPRLDAPGYPPAFEGWVRALLEKRIAVRFQCAADAAAALLTLPVDVDGPASGARDPAPRRPVLDELTVVLGPLGSVAHSAEDGGPVGSADGLLSQPDNPERVRRARIAPVSRRWDEAIVEPEGATLAAAAPRLLGWRRPRTVGQREVRDALWSSLIGVVHSGRGAAVALIGPPGCGQSHLVRWCGERAAELGVARVLRVARSDDPRALCLRWLALPDPPDAAAIADRVPYDLVELVRSLVGVGDGAGAGLRSVRERVGALARVIARTADRAVVVVIDDLATAPELEALAVGLAQAAGPILVVAAASGAPPAELARIGRTVAVPPLDPESCYALIAGLVPLDGELGALLVDRAAGNPSYVVDQVVELVRSGALTARGSRYVRSDGALDGIGALGSSRWHARVDDAVHALGARAVAAEILAALGGDAPADTVRAASLAFGVDPEDALGALGDRGLVRTDGQRVWFAHPAVRDAWLALAEAGRRRDAIHLACAAVVADPLARAVHRAEVGAADPDDHARLRDAIDAALREGSRHRAARLLAAYDRALGPAVAEDDARRLYVAAGRCALAILGTDAGAEALVTALTAQAERVGTDRARAEALRVRVRLWRLRGDRDKLTADASACIALAERLDDPTLAADMALALANGAARFGRVDDALQGFARARHAYERAGDSYQVASTWLADGACRGNAGDGAGAQAALERAVDLFERAGSVWGVALSTSDLGDTWLMRGDVDTADGLFRRAVALFDTIGHPDVAFARLGLAQVHLARGERVAARVEFDAVIHVFAGRTLAALVRLMRLVCLAGAGEWARFDAELAEAGGEVVRTGVRDLGTMRAVVQAGAIAREAGELARAEAAWRFAAERLDAAGHADEAGAVRQRLAALTSDRTC